MTKNIAQALEKKGYHVFFDYDSIENGEFNTQRYKAIEKAKDFILILSENALNDCVNENDWVKDEILHARRNNKDSSVYPDHNFIIPPRTEMILLFWGRSGKKNADNTKQFQARIIQTRNKFKQQTRENRKFYY